jgi:hypothetical protein
VKVICQTSQIISLKVFTQVYFVSILPMPFWVVRKLIFKVIIASHNPSIWVILRSKFMTFDTSPTQLWSLGEHVRMTICIKAEDIFRVVRIIYEL